MTVVARSLIGSKYAENSQTTQYTASTGMRTIIDKFTVSNDTTGSVSFAVNLVATGGSASASNLILNRAIMAGEEYTLPEVVGHVLNPGDFVSTLAGAASSLVIRMSGREIT